METSFISATQLRQKTTACRPLHPPPRTQRTTSSAMGAQPRSQRTEKTQGNICGHPEEGHGCARRGGAGHTDEG